MRRDCEGAFCARVYCGLLLDWKCMSLFAYLISQPGWFVLIGLG